jgi:hypothetical protein
MEEQKIKLVKGGKYLIENIVHGSSSNQYDEIFVLNISKTAYKIKWESGNSEWMSLTRFADGASYRIIEDITNLSDLITLHYTQEPCVYCGGSGHIGGNNSHCQGCGAPLNRKLV